MTNYVATIHEALSATLTAIKEAQAAMYAEANTQRQQLRDLLASMRGHARAMSDLGNIVGEASVVLYDIGEDMNEVADAVHDSTLDFGLVPEGDYQGLIGFCEECGREVRAGDQYEVECGEVICADCLYELEQPDDALAEPIEEEQTEPNVAETERTLITDRNLAANEHDAQLTIDDIAPNTVADTLNPTTTDAEYAEVEVALVAETVEA